jgi:sporulation protein YlmC with PRC-barrel domain
MIKHTLTAAVLTVTLASPSFAQQPASSPPGAMPQQGGTQKPGFVQNQSPQEWRGSKLIGASVYGPDNQSIGEVSDLVVDGSGKVKAAVVGVGGFLGVGQKDVAIPFEALNVSRKPNSGSIDKITVSYSKDELKNAPKFAYYEPTGSSQTTGSSTSGGGTMNGTSGTNR